MKEKKKSIQTYDAEFMALPPLKMVLGDVPEPDVHNPRLTGTKVDRKMESAVKKLVNYLKDSKA